MPSTSPQDYSSVIASPEWTQSPARLDGLSQLRLLIDEIALVPTEHDAALAINQTGKTILRFDFGSFAFLRAGASDCVSHFSSSDTHR